MKKLTISMALLSIVSLVWLTLIHNPTTLEAFANSYPRWFTYDQKFVNVSRPKYKIPRELQTWGGRLPWERRLQPDPHFRANLLETRAVRLTNEKTLNLMVQGVEINPSFSKEHLKENLVVVEYEGNSFEYSVPNYWVAPDTASKTWVLGTSKDALFILLPQIVSNFDPLETEAAILEVSIPFVDGRGKVIVESDRISWQSVFSEIDRGFKAENIVTDLCNGRRVILSRVAEMLESPACKELTE